MNKEILNWLNDLGVDTRKDIQMKLTEMDIYRISDIKLCNAVNGQTFHINDGHIVAVEKNGVITQAKELK